MTQTWSETAEHAELRDTVRAVLGRHEGAAAWAPLTGRIGAAALAVPEEYGGLGCGLPEVAVVAEELGRHLSPVPYLGSAVLAVTALVASGDTAARARLLPALADGTAVGALAWAEQHAGPTDPWDPTAIRTLAAPTEAGVAGPAGSPRPAGLAMLSGCKDYVLAGERRPEVLLVFARRADDGGRLGLYEVLGEGVEHTVLPTLDRTRPLARVVLRHAPARLLSADGEAVLARVRDAGAVALAAEQAGGARRALADTVAYTRQRVQFGRPVGSFQAVKHRLADLHTAVASARSLTFAAAEADASEQTLLAAAARSAAAEAYQQAAAETVQLHGGIGITWEHPAHDHLKRAHATARLLGPPAAHRARIAAALWPDF
ncbi:acyl-CoA dehydrogenase family protein [Streptomyces sp. NPDC053493]|uniref:acyl-CoA dehydrogenase family protein n=1 Tax=Streptomyces sp. NPDC053493 TaxID=3365705 RepID=UPI0037D1C247